MSRYYLSVGEKHNVKPGNIVGCIANEADIDSDFIGSINILETFSTVDLPSGMPPELLQQLKKARIAGTTLGIRAYNDDNNSNKKSSKRRSKTNSNSRSVEKPKRNNSTSKKTTKHKTAATKTTGNKTKA